MVTLHHLQDPGIFDDPPNINLLSLPQTTLGCALEWELLGGEGQDPWEVLLLLCYVLEGLFWVC